MFLENVLWGEDCIRCFYLEHGFKKKQPSTHTAQQALQTCSQSVAPTLAAAAAAGVGGVGVGSGTLMLRLRIRNWVDSAQDPVV